MRNVVLGICLLMNCAVTFAQEAVKQPQTLITEKQMIRAIVKLPNGEEVKLRGEAFYQVKEVNSDDTLMGKFVFTLSAEAHKLLAKNDTAPIEKIPVAIESENVLAEFARKTECPVIHLELQKLSIGLTTNLSATFERSKLDLKETPQEVSALICRLARSLVIGRHTRVGRTINRLLKGEATDN